jgi:hypothetical protein
MKKQGFVYMWVNKDSGKKYIGSHYGSLDDGYISSSNYFNEFYEKDPNLFSRKILHKGLSRKDAILTEQQILCDVDAANNTEFYNLHNYSGNGWSHHSNPELAKIYYKRISEAKKGKPSPHKGKALWGEHNRHKLKIDTWEIITPAGETIIRKNMLEFCKEHKLNPSAMSAVARGSRRHYKGFKCKKITNNRNVEYVYKEWKSKGKPGKAMYGADNPFAKSIEVDGITYGCMAEAVTATGLSMYKLRKIRKNNGK